MEKYVPQWHPKFFKVNFSDFLQNDCVQKNPLRRVWQHQKWMLQKFYNGFTICTKWIIFPFKSMDFHIQWWKMTKHLNHQIQSNIDIFKRQLAHFYSIFIENYAHWEIWQFTWKPSILKPYRVNTKVGHFQWIACQTSKELFPRENWHFSQWMLYRSVYLHENHQIFMKSVNFREITEFNQFSKESLLPTDGFSWKIVCFSKNTNFLSQMQSRSVCFTEILWIFRFLVKTKNFHCNAIPFDEITGNLLILLKSQKNTNFSTVMQSRLSHLHEILYILIKSLVFLWNNIPTGVFMPKYQVFNKYTNFSLKYYLVCTVLMKNS